MTVVTEEHAELHRRVVQQLSAGRDFLVMIIQIVPPIESKVCR